MTVSGVLPVHCTNPSWGKQWGTLGASPRSFCDDSEDTSTCQTHRESHGLWGQMNTSEHHYSTYFPLASESVWARGD